jgi:hypothetical protein
MTSRQKSLFDLNYLKSLKEVTISLFPFYENYYVWDMITGKYLPILLLTLVSTVLSAQDIGNYDLVIEEMVWQEAPALQSYVFGVHDDKWILIGGRTDGLHRRQPWATFWEEDNNRFIYLLDPANRKVDSVSIEDLPQELSEQLASTNMQFSQVGETLYITGGYAYSPSFDDHTTFPYLCKVHIAGLVEAIEQDRPISPYFTFTSDDRMQVTGGNMLYLNGWFYLVGGQKFIGRYNPMGPDHGPGFIQEYTNEIRKFKIGESDGKPIIEEYTAWSDKDLLHRRDYNLAPYVFEDGEPGFMLFTGVFQHEEDIPWLNSVKITEAGYEEIPDFEQRFCQYHTAKADIFDETRNEMYTIFFGGIGRYYIDEGKFLINDINVPFVKTISLVTRNSEGEMTEYKIGETEGDTYLGASSWLIPSKGTTSDILRINDDGPDQILIGHVYGGIESDFNNIFFENDGSQSQATNRIFKLNLQKKGTVNVDEKNNRGGLITNVYPVPTGDSLTLEYYTTKWERNQVWITNSEGKIIQKSMDHMQAGGTHKEQIDVSGLHAGNYYIFLKSGELEDTRQFAVH